MNINTTTVVFWWEQRENIVRQAAQINHSQFRQWRHILRHNMWMPRTEKMMKEVEKQNRKSRWKCTCKVRLIYTLDASCALFFCNINSSSNSSRSCLLYFLPIIIPSFSVSHLWTTLHATLHYAKHSNIFAWIIYVFCELYFNYTNQGW